MMIRLGLLGVLLMSGIPACADGAELVLKATTIPIWKAVYGQVEARNNVLARTRIGGTIVDLRFTEGDRVKAGDVVAVVRDDKFNLQIEGIEAQKLALEVSLRNAVTELSRARSLIKTGAATAQRVDQLQTEADVIRSQIAATEAQRLVLVQQQAEGSVLAPSDGRVLKVLVTKSAVVLPGEVVANIAGGGFYLRLAIPERHAVWLREGAQIRIGADGKPFVGRLAKLYPKIEGGRVTADVEVAGLDTTFVDARVLVELPVGGRQAIIVPRTAISTRGGIDFVGVVENGKEVERVVVVGETVDLDGITGLEILSGLQAGDVVVTP